MCESDKIHVDHLPLDGSCNTLKTTLDICLMFIVDITSFYKIKKHKTFYKSSIFDSAVNRGLPISIPLK